MTLTAVASRSASSKPNIIASGKQHYENFEKTPTLYRAKRCERRRKQTLSMRRNSKDSRPRFRVKKRTKLNPMKERNDYARRSAQLRYHRSKTRVFQMMIGKVEFRRISIYLSPFVTEAVLNFQLVTRYTF